MNDDVWRAPGRATPGDGPPPDVGRWGAPAGGPDERAAATPPNPYASPADQAVGGYPGPGAPYDAFATSDRHRQRVLGAPGYTTPAYRNDPVAVTSLIFGIVGILVPGVFLLAIATGHWGLRRLRRSYDGGRGLAVAGLVMGYVTLALWASLFLLALITRATIGP